MKIKLGFLASHRGTNMQCIIDACVDGRLDAVPVVVISNNGSSMALDRAERAGIPAYHLGSTNFPDEGVLDCAVRDTLLRHGVDLVVLAGYMKKIGSKTLKTFNGRIINVHPALLPRHGGKGMFGMNVHKKVLESGDTETGVTIHAVNHEYDTGPILAQRTVPVLEEDTPETLAARVLPVEHQLYVETIAKITRGEIPLPVES